MSELVFVGLGLYDERDISLRGLEAMKQADAVFVELYTSLMPGFNVERLEHLTGKKILPVSRQALEEENGRQILEAARKGKAVFLVPGDPLIATTHVDMRIRAENAGIQTRIIHNASIISAAIGLSGLQNYKFGRSVTIPFPDYAAVSETPFQVVQANLEAGLHTLCFLDIRAEEHRYMSISEALNIFLRLGQRKPESVITRNSLVVGVARAGSKSPIVKADVLEGLLEYDFGAPPQLLIFPGKLHFMEVEALIELADAPESLRKTVKQF